VDVIPQSVSMLEQSKHLHRSNYGDLWTDTIEALELLAQRVNSGQINQDQEYLLRQWIANGYVILEGAVDETLCSELAQELATIFEGGSDTVLYQDPEALLELQKQFLWVFLRKECAS
jgi:hypothetical protein